jgi:hypothetical protein
MSGEPGAGPDQAAALRTEQILTEIRRNQLEWDRILVEAERMRLDRDRIRAETDQRRIDAQRTQQEMRYEPLKFLLSGMAAGAGLVGASVALAAFFFSRLH